MDLPDKPASLLAQSFDPYGNPYVHSVDGVTCWGFTGEQTDANELVFLRARYYQPRVGRFLTKDPWPGNLTKLLTLNRWSYVEGNPINLVDPSGYLTEADEDEADGILEVLNSRYQVLILKDYGWGPDNSQGYGICQNKWHEGAWKDINELRWVQEAIFKTAALM